MVRYTKFSTNHRVNRVSLKHLNMVTSEEYRLIALMKLTFQLAIRIISNKKGD